MEFCIIMYILKFYFLLPAISAIPYIFHCQRTSTLNLIYIVRPCNAPCYFNFNKDKNERFCYKIGESFVMRIKKIYSTLSQLLCSNEMKIKQYFLYDVLQVLTFRNTCCSFSPFFLLSSDKILESVMYIRNVISTVFKD